VSANDGGRGDANEGGGVQMKADGRLNANEGRKMAGAGAALAAATRTAVPPPRFFLLSEYKRLLYQQQSIYIIRNFFNKL